MRIIGPAVLSKNRGHEQCSFRIIRVHEPSRRVANQRLAAVLLQCPVVAEHLQQPRERFPRALGSRYTGAQKQFFRLRAVEHLNELKHLAAVRVDALILLAQVGPADAVDWTLQLGCFPGQCRQELPLCLLVCAFENYPAIERLSGDSGSHVVVDQYGQQLLVCAMIGPAIQKIFRPFSCGADLVSLQQQLHQSANIAESCGTEFLIDLKGGFHGDR